MATITGTWYFSEDHPLNDDDPVGGARGSEEVLGTLSEIFEVGKSKMLGRGYYERYRKIYFLNEGNAIADAVAFFQEMQHIDQIAFAFEQTPGDSSVDSLTIPAGYVDEDFLSPVGLIDAEDIPLNPIPALTGEIAFWLRQRIPEGLSPETGALARLRIAGDVSP